jgi:hypothetical protein
VSAMLVDLPQCPVHEVCSLTHVPSMDEAPHRPAIVTATGARPEVLCPRGLDDQARSLVR